MPLLCSPHKICPHTAHLLRSSYSYHSHGRVLHLPENGPCPVFVTAHVDVPDRSWSGPSYILWSRQGRHQWSGGSVANQRAPWGQSDQSEAAISSDDHQARNKREKEVWYLKMNWIVVWSKWGCDIASYTEFMDGTLRRLNIMSSTAYYSGGADISSLKSLFHAPLLYYGWSSDPVLFSPDW